MEHNKERFSYHQYEDEFTIVTHTGKSKWATVTTNVSNMVNHLLTYCAVHPENCQIEYTCVNGVYVFRVSAALIKI